MAPGPGLQAGKDRREHPAMAIAASALPVAQLKLEFCHFTYGYLCFHRKWGKKALSSQGANGQPQRLGACGPPGCAFLQAALLVQAKAGVAELCAGHGVKSAQWKHCDPISWK